MSIIVTDGRTALHIDALDAYSARLTRISVLADWIDRYQIENIDDNQLGYAITMLVDELRSSELEQAGIQDKLAALEGVEGEHG